MPDMPPWESYGWFELPRVKSYASGMAVQKIAPAEVRRMVLMLGSTTSTGISVSPRPDVVTAESMLVGQNGPLILTQREHGALCQCDWYMPSGGFSTAIVIELMVRDWPRADTWSNEKLINAIGALVRALQGGQRVPATPAPQPPAPPILPRGWDQRRSTPWPKSGP